MGVLHIVINAPNVIDSGKFLIRADFPTNRLLPFLAQIIMSFSSISNFSDMEELTLTISSNANLPFRILQERNTIVPFSSISVGLYVRPIQEFDTLRTLHHSQLLGISKGICSVISKHFLPICS